MKSYHLSLFESLIILNSQDLKSDFFDSRLEGSTLSRTDHRCATPEVPCGPSHCRESRPSAPDLAADHQLGGSGGPSRARTVRLFRPNEFSAQLFGFGTPKQLAALGRLLFQINWFLVLPEAMAQRISSMLGGCKPIKLGTGYPGPTWAPSYRPFRHDARERLHGLEL